MMFSYRTQLEQSTKNQKYRRHWERKTIFESSNHFEADFTVNQKRKKD